MDINSLLDKLWMAEEKNTFIMSGSDSLLYQSRVNDIPPDVVLKKLQDVSFDFDEQEFTDVDQGLFFNVRRTVIRDGDEDYFCYRVTDISEYMQLIKDVAAYSKMFAKMSRFQTTIMNNLSGAYDSFLPGLCTYCNADEVMMFMYASDKIIKSVYKNGTYHTEEISPEEYERYKGLSLSEAVDGCYCVFNSDVQERHCAVFVRGMDTDMQFMEIAVHNIMSLFIERSILEEKLRYESEHDKLTGLYNKGKYIKLRKGLFGRPKTIAIYNFDVNNLKNINDNFGHEYGDSLIVKAARSISAVTSNNILGFRMGGDEYVMVAKDITREEAEELKLKWQSALSKINQNSDDVYVAMACGMVFGSGEYDYDEMYFRADKLMYEDKSRLKANNITSHIIN